MSQKNPEWPIKQFALSPPLRVQIVDEVTGLGFDLTGVTAVAHMTNPADGSAIFTDHPVVGEDLANGILRLVWAAGDTNVAGTMLLEFEGDNGETYPQDGYIYVHILPDLNGS